MKLKVSVGRYHKPCQALQKRSFLSAMSLEVEEMGLKLSITEGGKEGKHTVIAS